MQPSALASSDHNFLGVGATNGCGYWSLLIFGGVFIF